MNQTPMIVGIVLFIHAVSCSDAADRAAPTPDAQPERHWQSSCLPTQPSAARPRVYFGPPISPKAYTNESIPLVFRHSVEVCDAPAIFPGYLLIVHARDRPWPLFTTSMLLLVRQPTDKTLALRTFRPDWTSGPTQLLPLLIHETFAEPLAFDVSLYFRPEPREAYHGEISFSLVPLCPCDTIILPGMTTTTTVTY